MKVSALAICLLAMIVIRSSAVRATELHCSDRNMVLVPAGGFAMGSDEEHLQTPKKIVYKHSRFRYVGWAPFAVHMCVFFRLNCYFHPSHVTVDSRPRRQVELDAYCIDIWQYPNSTRIRPKTGYSYEEARERCETQGKRLCSEAEWEKACRGPEDFEFPYGREYVSGLCNTGKRLASGGSFPYCVSGYGVRHMNSNVLEWTTGVPMKYPWSADQEGLESAKRILRGGNARDATGRPFACSFRAADYADAHVMQRSSGRRPSEAGYGMRCCSEADIVGTEH